MWSTSDLWNFILENSLTNSVPCINRKHDTHERTLTRDGFWPYHLQPLRWSWSSLIIPFISFWVAPNSGFWSRLWGNFNTSNVDFLIKHCLKEYVIISLIMSLVQPLDKGRSTKSVKSWWASDPWIMKMLNLWHPLSLYAPKICTYMVIVGTTIHTKKL